MSMSGEAGNGRQAQRHPFHEARRRARTGFPRWLAILAAWSLVSLAGCSDEPLAQGSRPSDASASPEVGAPLDPGPTILTEGSEALAAGTYVLDLYAGHPNDERFPNIEITVPDGWSNLDGWGVTTGSESGSRWMGITFWDVDEVYRHPCDGSETIQPGRTVTDLASALAEQPLREASQPVDLTIDGHAGVQMGWSVPADFDFSTCDDGYFDSWTDVGGGGRYQQGPGQVDRLWILDVDGERLVVDAMYMPSADAKDRKELWRVMETIRFQS